MSLIVQKAVWESDLENSLRLIALALADFANDEGKEIWPGIPTLIGYVNASDKSIRRGLRALLKRGIILEDGYHGHVKRYRFDLERLARYRPNPVNGDRVPTRSSRANPVNGDRVPTRSSRASNPVIRGRQPGHPWPVTRSSVASIDPLDPSDPSEQETGADAPVPIDRVAADRINSVNVDRVAKTSTSRAGRSQRPHRISGSVCPHEPRCSSNTVCIDRIVTEQRMQSARRRNTRAFAATFEPPAVGPSPRRLDTRQPALLFDDPDPASRAS